ncbi:ATP-binding cassette domain-containing protein [Streptococcus sp. H49]|uniref:ATP-binding cassette domain-containing protein n=1 Tax=Streptococcus huangxiaojuni TaxID=3237239 RepID=UPI0034A18B7A
MKTLLKIQDLEVAYKKGQQVIKGVDLTLNKGTVYGLVGKNGSGKTTLLKTLSSVFNQNIYSLDNFLFLGKTSNLNSEFYRRNKYTVFAESESFLNWTFEKYIEMICKLYRLPIEEEKLFELVKGFKFENYYQKEIRELSTGNKKKVFLITGLYLRRPLLILDEPFDGLDFDATEYLYQRVVLYKKYGTVLMSTHFAESVVRVCDSLYILENGNLNLFQGNLFKWLELIKSKGASDDLESNL